MELNHPHQWVAQGVLCTQPLAESELAFISFCGMQHFLKKVPKKLRCGILVVRWSFLLRLSTACATECVDVCYGLVTG